MGNGQPASLCSPNKCNIEVMKRTAKKADAICGDQGGGWVGNMYEYGKHSPFALFLASCSGVKFATPLLPEPVFLFLVTFSTSSASVVSMASAAPDAPAPAPLGIAVADVREGAAASASCLMPSVGLPLSTESPAPGLISPRLTDLRSIWSVWWYSGNCQQRAGQPSSASAE